METLSPTTDQAWRQLLRWLREGGSALVAFSGGVDSAVLLTAAVHALGRDKVLGVHVAGDVFPSWERAMALRVAREHDLPCRVVEASPMGLEDFARNPADRCYHCKRFLLERLIALARREGFARVLDGSNADDTGDFRPGARALAELGARSPMKELGITKAQIREIARAAGLPNWDEPSSACLASRVPYGQPITASKLERIDAAERFVRERFGLRQVRARHDGPTVRIEVAPEEIDRLAASPAREAVVARMRELGFRYVSLDLAGYRTGSLNEVLGEAPCEAPGEAPSK